MKNEFSDDKLNNHSPLLVNNVPNSYNNMNNQHQYNYSENQIDRGELHPQLSNPHDEDFNYDLFFFIRSFLVVLSIALISINTVYGFALPHSNISCIEDKIFLATDRLNKFFLENLTARHSLIIIASLCVDFSMLYMSVIWCFWGKSWRLLISLLFFYLLRGIVQALFQMKYPEGFLWGYPGFPSIMVSYLKTNDFFYSGHVGLPVILMCEFQILRKYLMCFFCAFTCLFEAFTMIVTRGHYSIDIITGAIFAHYIFQNVSKYVHVLDNLTFKKNDYKENYQPFYVNEENLCNETRIRNDDFKFTPVPIKQEV